MPRKVEKTITIKAPPEAVWKALTDAEQLTAWFAAEAKVQPGAGGNIWMSWGPGFDGDVKIEIWDQGRHLRTADPKRPVAVDYHLEGKGGTTQLRLVQSFGDGDWDDEYNSTNVGWTIFLDNLRAFLENRPKATCRQAIVCLPVEGELDAVFAGALGPRGLGIGAGETGARFSTTCGAGDALSGHVVWSKAPNALLVEIDNLDARLYLTLEKFGGKPFLFLAFMAYAAPTPRVDVAELKARWAPMLERAVAPA
jgi:uncharacterized protein YndB with AHSA1/START domain